MRDVLGLHTLEDDPVGVMPRGALTPEEGIPVLPIHHLELPPFGNVLLGTETAMRENAITAHRAGSEDVAHQLLLRHVEVGVHEAVDTKQSPDGVAELDGAAVRTARGIVNGVLEKVIHRDGPVLDPFRGKVLEFHGRVKFSGSYWFRTDRFRGRMRTKH